MSTVNNCVVSKDHNVCSYQADSHRRIIAGYTLHETLGSGSFATVYKGLKQRNEDDCDETDEVAAIKVLSRDSTRLNYGDRNKKLENLEREIGILFKYRHPNIVALTNFHKSRHNFYLILEFCSGGDLKLLICSRKLERLSESLCRRLMRDLASGLSFLWSKKLIHRDIKPQNLLLTCILPPEEVVENPPKSENSSITMEYMHQKQQENSLLNRKFCLKIADFGFARHLQSTCLAETICGSPLYMAPEVLQLQKYDGKADLWSVGSVLFEMITGYTPFNGKNQIDLLRRMEKDSVKIPKHINVSKEAIQLLRLLLTRNPVQRGSFQDFLNATNAFVTLGCNDDSLHNLEESKRSTDSSTNQNMIHKSLNFNKNSVDEINKSAITQTERSKLNENYFSQPNSPGKGSGISSHMIANCSLEVPNEKDSPYKSTSFDNNTLQIDEEDFVIVDTHKIDMMDV